MKLSNTLLKYNKSITNFLYYIIINIMSYEIIYWHREIYDN